jgi:hypothetical protein
MQFIQNRAYAGRALPDLERVEEANRVYFVGDELPSDAPAESTLIEHWQENWDGGPPLLERVAIVATPFEPDDTIRLVAAHAARAHEHLAACGLQPLRRLTTIVGDARATSLAAFRTRDCLRDLQKIISELSPDFPWGKAVSVEEWSKLWDRLAAAGQVFPEQLEDLYGSFGPSGPPDVPLAWRGRKLGALPNPFQPLAAVEALGYKIVALADDEAVVANG